MTTHRSGPPAEHLRIYARSLGLPEDSDLATIVAAVLACRAACVARPDQIHERQATMANHPTARDCRTATLAAKAAAKILTAEQILAASAEDLVAFAASLKPRELADALYAVRDDDAASARLRGAAHAAAFGVPMMEPPAAKSKLSATAPAPGTLSAKEREYCATYGCDERVYLRLRADRDARAAKADAARLARRTADRAAFARAAASLRGGK